MMFSLHLRNAELCSTSLGVRVLIYNAYEQVICLISPSHVLSHSCIDSWIFTLYLGCNLILLTVQIVSTFNIGDFFSWNCATLTYPKVGLFVCLLSSSLLSGSTRCCRLILFSTSVPESAISPRIPDFFLLEKVLKTNIGVSAPYHWAGFTSRAS